MGAFPAVPTTWVLVSWLCKGGLEWPKTPMLTVAHTGSSAPSAQTKHSTNKKSTTDRTMRKGPQNTKGANSYPQGRSNFCREHVLCLCACLPVCRVGICTCRCTRTCACAHMCICICTCTRMFMNMHTILGVKIYVNMYTKMYAHVWTCRYLPL